MILNCNSLERLYGPPLQPCAFDIAGRSWTIDAVRDQDALLGASEQYTAFPFGLLLWDSAPALARELAQRATLVSGSSVLELGAGAGLTGLIARHLGARRVVQTDHSRQALALCQHNAAINQVTGIEFRLADWNAWQDEERYDLILGSDVLYDRAAHGAVLRILERNLAPGGRVLLTDPSRTDTPAFIAAVKIAGWQTLQRRLANAAPQDANDKSVDLIETWRS